MSLFKKWHVYASLASFAMVMIHGNEECEDVLASDRFQNFMAAVRNPDSNNSSGPLQLCSEFSGVLFEFDGKTSCGDAIHMHSNQTMCLPGCCSSNETYISSILPWVFGEGDWCEGSYTYNGLDQGELPPDEVVEETETCSDSTEPFDIKKMNGETKKASCEWVKKKRTVKRCNRPEVRAACPKTCNNCCEDSTETFVLKSGKVTSCEWISAKKSNERCKKKPARRHCHATCNKFC